MPMRSRCISLSYHLCNLLLVDLEWAEVVKYSEGGQGQTRKGHADQGEVRTEELSHGYECGCAMPASHDGSVMKASGSEPTVESC